MKEYQIKRIEETPDWNQIPTFEVDHNLWLPETGTQMTQQICYNQNGFYVHQHAVEHDICAERNHPLAQVCLDSCMEFFFSPSADSDFYFNFEFNPNGCPCVGWNDGKKLHVRLLPHDPARLFEVRVARSDDCWEVFYHIPVSYIQLFSPTFTLTPGRKIRANCYKCGMKTNHPHYLAWNPVTSPTPNFHRPCDFGTMILGE